MKKIILLSFVFLAGIQSSSAQQELKNAEDFNIGDKMVYLKIDNQTINPGKAGANVTWDISSLKLTGDTVSQEIIPVPEAYAKIFPQANSAEWMSDSTLVITNKQPATSEVWGIVRSGLVFNYTRPYLFIKRPLKYLDSISSTPERNYTVNIQMNGTGITHTVADGWGTLILPGATYKVLRVRFEQEYEDKDSYGNTMKMISVTYAWFDRDHKGALLRIDNTRINSQYYNKEINTIEYLLSETK